MKTLCEIEQNTEYIITVVKAEEPVRSRLVSMGFARGGRVMLLKKSAGAQTYHVKIEDSEVALRKEEAMLIFVKSKK